MSMRPFVVAAVAAIGCACTTEVSPIDAGATPDTGVSVAADIGQREDGGSGLDSGSTPGLDASAGGDASASDVGTPPGLDAGPQADTGPSMAPWVVFTIADSTAPMSANRLQNPGFESSDGGTKYPGWSTFQSGYQTAPGEGRTGNAIKIVRAAGDTNAWGANQSVTLNQKAAAPLYFAGWSRAQDVTGQSDSDYGVYMDIDYMTLADDPQNGCNKTASEPCALWGQVPSPNFDTGTHDWQQRDGFAMPAYPIKSVSFYVLFRGSHTGTVWFDDLVLSELTAAVVPFDGRIVAASKPAAPYTGGQALDLATTDGLGLSLWSEGGAVKSATLDGAAIEDAAWDYASGLFVHDAETKTWMAPGGHLTQDASGIVQTAAIPALELDLNVHYSATPDALHVKARVHSSAARDRAVTVYWALPAILPGASWGEDIRRSQPVAGAQELSNTTSFWYEKVGATGTFSTYPLATVFTDQSGLALGHPLDQPRIARLTYNPRTHQLYLAFDVGLTPDTTKFPATATVELVLYRTKPAAARYGFRSALQGFYDRFPSHFARRIPADQEGIWVAFPDLSKMVNGAGEAIEDFNIGFDELGSLDFVAFDDLHGIKSFRYIIEPASTWLQISDASVDPANPDQVKAYLEGLYSAGGAQKTLAEKTLSSAIYGTDGSYAYEPYTDGPPWCSGKCALFYLSADPDISEPPYTVNQATYHWNASTLATYTTTPGLDGEYIDSFVMEATRGDYRRSHLQAVDTPPTFSFATHQVMTPVIFSTLEFTRWLKPQIPAGKYLIANAMLVGVPWGADLMDFMGEEINWVQQVGGQYAIVPEDDRLLSYRRSLAHQRPYGFLMNTDFTNMSNALAERYMRVCLFYGIYPSMFSANASQGNYFENPALYNRDRALFKKYIPLIRRLNQGGWEAVTNASPSVEEVYLERFGSWPSGLYFTLRNTTDAPAVVTVTLDRASLGIAGNAVAKSLLLGTPDAALPSGQSTLTINLPAQEIEAVQISQ